MTLTRLVLAWVPTAVWFVTATLGITRLVALLQKPESRTGAGAGAGAGIEPAFVKWRMVEAALLTLFASLWFDSLGSGGWWLVFLLVGALATVPTWLRTRPEHPPRRALLIGACADLARYMVAGAILAWRLGESPQ